MVAGYSNAVVNEQTQLVTTFYVGIASFTILVWDHLLTLGDEVKYIWKKKKGPLIWLFLLNRYLTPLGFIVNLFAYFSNVWSEATCQHFVRYEGSMTVIGVNTAALMMLLRIYAMYDKHRAVVTFVAVVFCLELGTNAWLLTYGVAVRHSPSIHACTMIFDTSKVNKAAAAASAWLPLLYDTTVLGLTIRRTYTEIKYPSVGRTMRTLLKEGILYYSVIFCITLVLTLMIVLAPDGLKNIMAQTEYLMTVAMMSRITLHLKKEAHKTPDPLGSGTYDLTSSVLSQAGRRTSIAFAHSNHRPSMVLSPLWISVQEHSVTYNDRGEEVQMPKKSHRTTHVKRYSYEADEQWFEFAPLNGHDGHFRR